MALRLSGQLMYGVVKLYGQKTQQFLADVTHVHATIRKTFSDIDNVSSVVVTNDNLDMAATRGSKVSELTISDADLRFAGDFETPMDWSWEHHLDSGQEISALTDSGVGSGYGARSASRTPLRSTPQTRHTAAKEQITLPAYKTDMHDRDPGFLDQENLRGGAADRDDVDDIDFDVDDTDGFPQVLDLGLDLDPPPSMDLGSLGRRDNNRVAPGSSPDRSDFPAFDGMLPWPQEALDDNV